MKKTTIEVRCDRCKDLIDRDYKCLRYDLEPANHHDGNINVRFDGCKASNYRDLCLGCADALEKFLS